MSDLRTGLPLAGTRDGDILWEGRWAFRCLTQVCTQCGWKIHGIEVGEEGQWDCPDCRIPVTNTVLHHHYYAPKYPTVESLHVGQVQGTEERLPQADQTSACAGQD